MEKTRRVAAVILAAALLLAMLCSAVFIAAEASHDCVGENCPVCYQINVCQNTLKNLSLAVCAAAFAVAFTYALCRGISTCADCSHSYTLVSLKVKLSD